MSFQPRSALFSCFCLALCLTPMVVHASYRFTLEERSKSLPIKFGGAKTTVTASVFAWGKVDGNKMTYEHFSVIIEKANPADVLTSPGSNPKQDVTYRLKEPWELTRTKSSDPFTGSAKVFCHFLGMEESWNQNGGGTIGSRFAEEALGAHPLLRSQSPRSAFRDLSLRRDGNWAFDVGHKYDDGSEPFNPAQTDISISVQVDDSSEAPLLSLLETNAAVGAPTAMTMDLTLPNVKSPSHNKAKEFTWSSDGAWSISGQKLEASGSLTLDKIFVTKTVDVQPIFLKFKTKGDEVTGSSHDAVYKQKTIDTWKRAGLTINWLNPITYDITGAPLTSKHYPSTPDKAAAKALMHKIDKDLKSTLPATAIKLVYFKDILCCGGGFSYGGGGIGYVAMNNREAYCDDNDPPAAGKGSLAAAHELGHQFALFHPWDGSNSYGTTTQYNTLMCGSGFRRDNPNKISAKYKDKIVNPGFTGTLTTTALPSGDCDETGSTKCTTAPGKCSYAGLECGPEIYKVKFSSACPSDTKPNFADCVSDTKLVDHVKHFMTTWYKQASDPFYACVIGHASADGNGAKNLELSKKRATLVYNELGLPAAKMKNCPSPPLPNTNCQQDVAKSGLHWCGSNYADANDAEGSRRVDVIVFRP